MRSDSLKPVASQSFSGVSGCGMNGPIPAMSTPISFKNKISFAMLSTDCPGRPIKHPEPTSYPSVFKSFSPTLHGPCDRSQKWRGSLRFLPPLEMRPSSVAPNPVESREAPPSSQYPCPLRGTLGSSLKSPAEVEGNEGFLLQPEKDLESPSSTCLEALVPSQDSRAMTRSPSPRPRRPDFPGAAGEAP